MAEQDEQASELKQFTIVTKNPEGILQEVLLMASSQEEADETGRASVKNGGTFLRAVEVSNLQ